MNYSDRRYSTHLLYTFAAGSTGTLIYLLLSAFFWSSTPAYAQQDPFLSQRINMIEQRFSTIESRLNRLESDTRYSAMNQQRTPNTNDSEIRLLRTELDGARLRLTEDECGLVKLDERTLTATARAARSRTGVAPDPCRLDPGTPLRLSSRPR